MVEVSYYRINKEDKTRRRKARARIQREGKGKPCFCVVEEGRRLFLESDKIDGKELEERDRMELLKLGEWLESQALRDTESSDLFDIGRLYMYIMLQAKQEKDKEFLNWWMSYKFKIDKYIYNYQNGYSNIKKLVG